MRSVFDFPVERPVLAAALNLLLIAIGLGALSTLPVREYPSVDPPTVSVRTQYIGAPADVVERAVTKVIEDNLSGIDDIRQINSSSRNETSSINIEFAAGANIDAAAADVRDKVAGVRNRLPDDVEEPVIEKANADDQPMMWIVLGSQKLATPELTDLADRLIVDAVGIVPGVSRIQIGGEQRYAMRVWLDRRAMAARGITATDIVDRLEAENIEVPAGRFDTGQQELTLRAETRFATAAEFRNLTLRDVGGDRVTLGQVARVEVGIENYKSELRANGRPTVSLGIIRQSDANTLSVASGVREELDRVRGSLPDNVSLTVYYDESRFIRENLENVATTLALVVGVIVLVTWLFLGSLRATLIPALTIPASVIPAFAIAAIAGFSINTLTILAAILAISLCTDDAVVIVENVRRRLSSGEPSLVAATRATRQVGFAVFASAAVLVAVILPLGFIEGNVGRLFLEFAVVLASIVAFSTIASLTVAPMLASWLFRREEKPDRVARWVEARLNGLGRRYRGALEGGLGRPVVPALAALVLIAIGAAAFMAVPTELAPSEDRGTIRVQIEGPEGASFDYMRPKVAEIERLMNKYMPQPGAEPDEDGPPRPLASMLSIVSPGFGGAANANTAFLILRLTEWGDRDVTQAEFQGMIQRDLARVSGVRAFARAGNSLGQRRRGQQLQFILGGIDRAEVRQWSETLLDRASAIEGLQNPDLNYKDTRPQVTIAVDRARAGTLGVDARAIGDALSVFFGSREVTRYVDRGEEYEVILQAPDADRRGVTDLSNVYVRSTTTNTLLPLTSVVRLTEEGTVRELGRVDRLSAITLEGSLAPGLSLGDALAELEEIAATELPAEAQIRYTGEALDLQETGSSIYLLLALVLVLVYLVLAGQFESFIHPLIILISVPMALAGGVATMWLFGLTMNIFTQIALILLVGLVAKNAILLVEFANQLRSEGKSAREAALDAAGLRLRPILMTSVATILGAVPLIAESGAGAEARLALGIVTAGGLTIGTLLTLFLVPTAYVLVGDVTAAPDARADELARQERDTRDPEDLPANDESALPRRQAAE